MSDAHNVWRHKSDEELQQAARVLHEYKPEGRQAILDELERRRLESVDDRPRCPSCNVPIGLRDDHATCTTCGKAFPTSFQKVLSDWAGEDEPGAEEPDRTTFVDDPEAGSGVSAQSYDEPVTPSQPRKSSAVITRYRDGYRVASFVVTVGTVFKVLGVLVGCLLALVSLGSANSNPFGAGGAVLGGVLIGLMIGGFLFICGVFVAAQGQLLQATLDTAVSASPFLSDSERAQAMGLPRTVVARRSIRA